MEDVGEVARGAQRVTQCHSLGGWELDEARWGLVWGLLLPEIG